MAGEDRESLLSHSERIGFPGTPNQKGLAKVTPERQGMELGDGSSHRESVPGKPIADKCEMFSLSEVFPLM